MIDTTQARPGDTATFQVTATDATDGLREPDVHRHRRRLTAGPDAEPRHRLQAARQPGHGDRGRGQLDDDHPAGPGRLSRHQRDAVLQSHISYSLVSQPSHGTLTPTSCQPSTPTATFIYTPQPGYSGPDSFQYRITENGPTPYLGNWQYLLGPPRPRPATRRPWRSRSRRRPRRRPPASPPSPHRRPRRALPHPRRVLPHPRRVHPRPRRAHPRPRRVHPRPRRPRRHPRRLLPPPPPTTPTPTPPPLVTVTGIQDVTNQKHQVTRSPDLQRRRRSAEAANTANYQLIKQGKHGAFIATPTSTIKIKSASYDPTDNR